MNIFNLLNPLPSMEDGLKDTFSFLSAIDDMEVMLLDGRLHTEDYDIEDYMVYLYRDLYPKWVKVYGTGKDDIFKIILVFQERLRNVNSYTLSTSEVNSANVT